MRLMHGLLKIMQFFMNFIALWSQKESPAPLSHQFLNRSLFRSLLIESWASGL